ncbi:WD40 repeat-like protein [Schizophyllum commune Loenen D]|nr:WD40 repeat-like protein [Schizophyllum commune Loenen D]
MASSSSRVILPIVTAQPSFPEVVREVDDGMIPSEQIWVSCYRRAPPDSNGTVNNSNGAANNKPTSVHAKIDVTLDARDRNLVLFNTLEGDVRLEKDTRSGAYVAGCPSLNISPTTLTLASQEYVDPERADSQKPHRITALAVAPDGSTFASGFLDGSIHLYPVINEGLNRPLTEPPFKPYVEGLKTVPAKSISRAHLSTVTTLSYFASSRAILSGGIDFTLQVHPSSAPTELGRLTPTRTLKGHSRTVTGAHPISATGAVSVSADGTVRQWDVEEGEQVGMHIAATGVAALAGEITRTRPSEALVALADGRAQLVDLRAEHGQGGFITSRPTTFGAGSAIDAVDNTFAIGSSRGVVVVHDRRRPDAVLSEFVRNEGEGAAVGALIFLDTSRLAVATADGLPFIVKTTDADGSEPTVERELIGADCDAVRCLSRRGNELWAGGDDGVVRRYVV